MRLLSDCNYDPGWAGVRVALRPCVLAHTQIRKNLKPSRQTVGNHSAIDGHTNTAQEDRVHQSPGLALQLFTDRLTNAGSVHGQRPYETQQGSVTVYI